RRSSSNAGATVAAWSFITITTKGSRRSTRPSPDPEDVAGMFHVKRGNSRGWRLVVLLLALGITLAVGSIPVARLGASRAAPASSTAPYAPGVLLVRRKTGVTTAALTAQSGISGIDATLSFIGVERVRVARGQEQAVAQRLAQTGLVDFAQPD